MTTLQAIFDGTTLQFDHPLSVRKPVKVLVTFLEDDEITAEQLQSLAMSSRSFDFLHNSEEDIYTDEHLRERYQ